MAKTQLCPTAHRASPVGQGCRVTREMGALAGGQGVRGQAATWWVLGSSKDQRRTSGEADTEPATARSASAGLLPACGHLTPS